LDFGIKRNVLVQLFQLGEFDKEENSKFKIQNSKKKKKIKNKNSKIKKKKKKYYHLVPIFNNSYQY